MKVAGGLAVVATTRRRVLVTAASALVMVLNRQAAGVLAPLGVTAAVS